MAKRKTTSSERARVWRLAHPELQRAAEQRYRRENPTKRTESCRRWRQKNPEKARLASKRYAQRHPEKVKASLRRFKLKKLFGITLEQYNAMLQEQGGVCAICKRPERLSHRKNLTVDHCHATGRVRGILCGNCNTAIGLLGDVPELARAAAEYLER